MTTPEGERGAASVLALAIVGATTAAALAVVALAGVNVASQRAANAADAAALAAADAVSGAAPGMPCDLAERLAQRNGAGLVACDVDGPAVTVTVRTEHGGFVLEARARAGPPGWRERPAAATHAAASVSRRRSR